MLIPDAVLRFVAWLLKDRDVPLWELVERTFGVVELFSFALLFG
jgi:hypothetical protein